MVRSYVSLTSINFLNVGGVFLNEILLSYLEAGCGVVKYYKIEFWVEVTFFILLLRASKHSQLLLFSKNGIWWGKKSLYICVNPFKTLTKWDKIRVKNCQLGSVKKKKNSKGRDCSIWGKSICNLQMSFCIGFLCLVLTWQKYIFFLAAISKKPITSILRSVLISEMFQLLRKCLMLS